MMNRDLSSKRAEWLGHRKHNWLTLKSASCWELARHEARTVAVSKQSASGSEKGCTELEVEDF